MMVADPDTIIRVLTEVNGQTPSPNQSWLREVRAMADVRIYCDRLEDLFEIRDDPTLRGPSLALEVRRAESLALPVRLLAPLHGCPFLRCAFGTIQGVAAIRSLENLEVRSAELCGVGFTKTILLALGFAARGPRDGTRGRRIRRRKVGDHGSNHCNDSRTDCGRKRWQGLRDESQLSSLDSYYHRIGLCRTMLRLNCWRLRSWRRKLLSFSFFCAGLAVS